MSQISFLHLHSISENIESYLITEPSTVDISVNTPIARLQDTSLESIFYLASVDRLFCQNDSLESRASTARYASQVCRRWRSVATHFPPLWLGPVLSLAWTSSRYWIRLVLQRSYPEELLDVEIPPGIGQTQYAVIMTEISNVTRFKGLTVSMPPAFSSSEPQDVDPKYASFSTTCRIPLHLMENLSVGRSRRQPQSISLRYNPISSRHRHIQRLTVSSDSFLSVSQLLSALQSMQSLSSLHIQRPYSNSVAEISSNTPIPHIDRKPRLQRLESLAISAPIPTCATILTCLMVPVNCALVLECHLASPGPYLDEVLNHIKGRMGFWGCEPTSGGSQCLQIDASHFQYSVEVPHQSPYMTVERTRGHSRKIVKFQPSISLSIYWPQTLSGPERMSTVTTLFSRCMASFQHSRYLPITLEIDVDNDLAITPELHGVILEWLALVSDYDSAGIYDVKLRTSQSVFLIMNAIQNSEILPDLSCLIFIKICFEGSRMLRRAWKLLLSSIDKRSRESESDCSVEFVLCEFSNFDAILKMTNAIVTSLSINGKDYKDFMDESMDNDDYDSDDTIHGH